jgi:hypothetical protein
MKECLLQVQEKVGTGEVEKFPLGVLLDNFTLETDLVGAITAAGAGQ